MDKDKFIQEYFTQYNKMAAVMQKLHNYASQFPDVEEMRKKFPNPDMLDFALHEITINMRMIEKRGEIVQEMFEDHGMVV